LGVGLFGGCFSLRGVSRVRVAHQTRGPRGGQRLGEMAVCLPGKVGEAPRMWAVAGPHVIKAASDRQEHKCCAGSGKSLEKVPVFLTTEFLLKHAGALQKRSFVRDGHRASDIGFRDALTNMNRIPGDPSLSV